MDIKQNEQTRGWVLPRPKKPNYVFSADQRDLNIGPNQTKQNEIREFGYQSEPADQNTGITHTKQTEAWILSRKNGSKYGC